MQIPHFRGCIYSIRGVHFSPQERVIPYMWSYFACILKSICYNKRVKLAERISKGDIVVLRLHAYLAVQNCEFDKNANSINCGHVYFTLS